MDVSVIIPVYNASDYLKQCLKSIEQADLSVEILCINDGSTDDSLAIMKKAALRDKRIRVIDKPNEGYGATLNRGIREAQGTYLGILEPDDYLEGNLYSALFALACKNGNPEIVKSAYWDVSGDGKKVHCGFWRRIKPPAQPFCLDQAPLLTRYHPSIWSALYRKDFLLTNNIVFREVPGAGWVDNPFMMETFIKAHHIVYTDASYYCYRSERAGSSTAILTDYLMPLNRWNEMTDLLEAANVKDSNILGIHAYRAFFYLEASRKAHNFNESEWTEQARSMLMRIRPEIIARSPFVSPSNRKLYENLIASSLSGTNSIPYLLMLATEAIWKTRQNGLGYLVDSIKSHKRG